MSGEYLAPKDPQATLDYGINWSSVLPAGDTIASSSWAVDPGLTKGDDYFNNTATTVWLSGGTDETSYQITNHIVTQQGRTDERSFYIYVMER